MTKLDNGDNLWHIEGMPNSHSQNDHEEPIESEEEFVLPDLDHTTLNIRLTTLKKAYKFLDHFSTTANVTASAAAAGITRRTVYMLKKKVLRLLKRGISPKIMLPKISPQSYTRGQSTGRMTRATCC